MAFAASQRCQPARSAPARRIDRQIDGEPPLRWRPAKLQPKPLSQWQLGGRQACLPVRLFACLLGSLEAAQSCRPPNRLAPSGPAVVAAVLVAVVVALEQLACRCQHLQLFRMDLGPNTLRSLTHTISARQTTTLSIVSRSVVWRQLSDRFRLHWYYSRGHCVARKIFVKLMDVRMASLQPRARLSIVLPLVFF